VQRFTQRIAPAGISVAVALLYLASAAPGLSWAHEGDSGGAFAAAVYTLGIPQPTGYPTYVLLGKLFMLLPWGARAWRLNLFAALAGAGAIGLLTATLRRLLRATGRSWLSTPAMLLAADRKSVV
jgi:hypothetical protein